MSYQYGFGYEDLEEAPPFALAGEQLREPEVHILFIGADADLAERAGGTSRLYRRYRTQLGARALGVALRHPARGVLAARVDGDG